MKMHLAGCRGVRYNEIPGWFVVYGWQVALDGRGRRSEFQTPTSNI